MTAVVAVDLRPFNELCVIADTRITYEQQGKTYIHPNGLQKIIPVISKDKQHVGALGFSGYLSPLKIIIEYLLREAQITNYRAPFIINSVVENLRSFIQAGFNKVPNKYKNLPFMFMFVTIDTARTSIVKDSKGNVIENPFEHPIYLSQMYLFRPNKKHKIEVVVSNQTMTIIGSGAKATSTLSPQMDNAFSFGRPYDGTPQFRSWLIGEITSNVFQTEKISTVGSPYWIWEILDPKRNSRHYWQWGYNPTEGNPEIKVEQSGYNFVITNKITGEKRTILHVLNWNDSLHGALA